MSCITSYKNNKPYFSEKIALDYIEVIKKFLKSRLKKANGKGFVVGISGGIDSALTYALAKLVAPNDTIGVVMPINSMTDSDLKHIAELEEKYSTKFLNVDLSNVFNEHLKAINVNNKLSVANIKPRLRMTTLYAIAQENNSLVLGTDNAAEVFIGYFTKFGDGGADLLPISRLTKGEVRYISQLLNLPSSIINKKPSAGLWEGQTDEDELGVSYEQIDFLINSIESKQSTINLPKNIIDKILNLHIKTEHKRDKIYKPQKVKKYNLKRR